ncbi:hypothetical protein SEA_BEARDEDLADY_3 [Streptomyces phage BeardedLady]|uniref:Uncharacterized protein n=1 Tax=Streptomyces phage BeardedLady TaxID=2024286 RepID=A0A291AV55_9CAUD|nr:hypothetical protein SEA_BEARDEDLADY_3 [Streptomyces phage BeardedLady]
MGKRAGGNLFTDEGNTHSVANIIMPVATLSAKVNTDIAPLKVKVVDGNGAPVQGVKLVFLTNNFENDGEVMFDSFPLLTTGPDGTVTSPVLHAGSNPTYFEVSVDQYGTSLGEVVVFTGNVTT